MAAVNCAAASRFFLNKHFGYHVRRVVSALHIPGYLANSAVSILTPSLDHIESLITTDKEETLRNLSARNYSFDLATFTSDWRRMEQIRLHRDVLEEKRIENSYCMRDLVNASKQSDSIKTKRGPRSSRDDVNLIVQDASRIQELKEEGKKLRAQLKDLMPVWWEAEEKAITQALNLPNSLHPETPLREDRLIGTYGTNNVSHGQLPSEEILQVDDISHTAYFLKGRAALLELEWMRSFCRKWIQQDFHLISAPDFVKSIVVDGCGFKFNDPDRVMSLATLPDHGSVESGNGLHLVGGASLPAIVAFLTKTVIQEPFPLRLMSTGRLYQPVKRQELSGPGTWNTVQASAIQLLSAVDNNANALTRECSRIHQTMLDIFQQLGIHFRTCAVAAPSLERWEQHRTAFQMYCPSAGKYVEVASISIVGDYMSRRLSIYGPGGSLAGFVTAQALSVPKLLSCYLKEEEERQPNITP